MEPMENHGVQVMSIGFLIDADTPMIWRGPMATQALEQLLRADQLARPRLPDRRHAAGHRRHPAHARAAVPVTGAVIVTTPQDIALLDASKGLKMFEKVGVPILGIVENMAVHVCSNCGHAEHIFGAGRRRAHVRSEYGVDYLGALPLDIRIREQADSGKPTVVADPDGEVARTSIATSRARSRSTSPRRQATSRRSSRASRSRTPEHVAARSSIEWSA